MAFEDFTDINRRKASDKILRDKAFNTAKNSQYDGYWRGHASMVFKFIDKKTFGSGIKIESISNKRPLNWRIT